MRAYLARVMTCEAVTAVVWEYLDGELDEARREIVLEHLAQCCECRGRFAFESAFLRSLATVLDEPLDTTCLRAKILAALRGEGESIVSHPSPASATGRMRIVTERR